MRTTSSASPPEPLPPSFAADVAECRRVLACNSRTFHAASLLLPRAVRDPACVLYGFCRIADDLVDVEGGRFDAIAKLQHRIARACEGRPAPVAADRALAVIVRRHGIPRAVLEALVDGLRWDAEGRRYETLDALLDYAARVAGTVGVMMSLLMGARSRAALARAADLGTAMQLTNIARDIGEDARMGRVYLPLAWLREAGIDPDAFLADPAPSPALASVVARLLAVADALYARVDAGVALLPLGCRPGINAARRLYAEIGREVERAGHDAVTRRAVVPGRRKARLLLQATLALWPDRAAAEAPVLPSNAMLVDAAAARTSPGDAPPRWWQVSRRAAGTLVLFDRLGRRDAGWQ